MQINDLTLPKSFVDCIVNRTLHREIGVWDLVENDYYGNEFQSNLAELYETEDAIKEATSDLHEHFAPDGVYGEESEWANEPGFIPDIIDFSKIITFGFSGDGAPFCFDFRESKEPSIIWWDDVYWRKVAPTFDDFLKLIVK